MIRNDRPSIGVREGDMFNKPFLIFEIFYLLKAGVIDIP